MPEKINDRTIFSLSEVALNIQKTLMERYTSSFWIKAEMNRLNHYPQSGHCYPDLIEKTDGKIVAEMRSTIWKDDFQRINENFVKTLHEPLKNGIKILFCAKISFSPVYGLSLRILDIDPSWSLGELEKEKQLTIERIRKEGIFARNKSLIMPLLPKRIAVISVETSKGYADFRKIIDDNEWHYSLFYMLFPAILQGENAVVSIRAQLDRISKVMQHFDAVAIIRGGGGDVGLSCYNNYDLATSIALFPLPVITGIGHSTNETVAEMVACRNSITPTELADFLMQKFHNFSIPVAKAQETIVGKITRLLRAEKSGIVNVVRYLRSVTIARLSRDRNEIQQEKIAMQQQSGNFLKRMEVQSTIQKINIFTGAFNLINDQLKNIRAIEKNIELLDPVNVLNRGYSITTAAGKAVKSVEGIKNGMKLITLLADGNLASTVQSVNKTESND